MTNDPELDGKYLGTITQDFVKIAKVLQEAAYQIRVRNISDYPIFAISKDPIQIGQLLIEQGKGGLTWNYYISYLEDFKNRQLIETDKEDFFKENYKNPDEFCCLFVVDVDKGFTNFVYIPFPEDDLID
ncbi:MAG: hypothetical protein MUE85_13310 [Microscillaceae bacterium]|jgi:hypothetical protein|nr:hypothetical protein [Microscillaceae bacterium]